ncbi:hypothetical protein BaRGS_00002463 [Batillaria attramentaria]|uniref:Uncharacterized protein n=1 Tax=Batillaria attramentaria TaxID=370345 RepID=A0ABD0M3K9_9CAEN
MLNNLIGLKHVVGAYPNDRHIPNTAQQRQSEDNCTVSLPLARYRRNATTAGSCAHAAETRPSEAMGWPFSRIDCTHFPANQTPPFRPH